MMRCLLCVPCFFTLYATVLGTMAMVPGVTRVLCNLYYGCFEIPETSTNRNYLRRGRHLPVRKIQPRGCKPCPDMHNGITQVPYYKHFSPYNYPEWQLYPGNRFNPGYRSMNSFSPNSMSGTISRKDGLSSSNNPSIMSGLDPFGVDEVSTAINTFIPAMSAFNPAMTMFNPAFSALNPGMSALNPITNSFGLNTMSGSMTGKNKFNCHNNPSTMSGLDSFGVDEMSTATNAFNPAMSMFNPAFSYFNPAFSMFDPGMSALNPITNSFGLNTMSGSISPKHGFNSHNNPVFDGRSLSRLNNFKSAKKAAMRKAKLANFGRKRFSNADVPIETKDINSVSNRVFSNSPGSLSKPSIDGPKALTSAMNRNTGVDSKNGNGDTSAKEDNNDVSTMNAESRKTYNDEIKKVPFISNSNAKKKKKKANRNLFVRPKSKSASVRKAQNAPSNGRRGNGEGGSVRRGPRPDDGEFLSQETIQVQIIDIPEEDGGQEVISQYEEGGRRYPGGDKTERGNGGRYPGGDRTERGNGGRYPGGDRTERGNGGRNPGGDRTEEGQRYPGGDRTEEGWEGENGGNGNVGMQQQQQIEIIQEPGVLSSGDEAIAGIDGPSLTNDNRVVSNVRFPQLNRNPSTYLGRSYPRMNHKVFPVNYGSNYGLENGYTYRRNRRRLYGI